MTTDQQIRKLPLLATLKGAWSALPRNLGLTFQLYWPWLAVLVTCFLAFRTGVLLNSWNAPASPTLIGGAIWFPGLVAFFAVILAVPAIAVGWIRGIHRGERPTAPIRIDGAVWRFIGWSLLLGLVIGVMNAIVALIATAIGAAAVGLGDGPMSIARLMTLLPILIYLSLLPVAFLTSRFILVLPAAAIGQSVGLGDSFRLTRGNTWRLVFGTGLVSLPAGIVSGIAQVLLVAYHDNTALLATGSALIGLATIYNLHALLAFNALTLKELSPAEDHADVMLASA